MLNTEQATYLAGCRLPSFGDSLGGITNGQLATKRFR
jgi:hypothetical protein